MMDDGWIGFWRQHAQTTSKSEPQVQVLRTCGGHPIAPELFELLVQRIVSKLDLHPKHAVLDLCCGNGLITNAIAELSGLVVAVDVVPDFVTAAGRSPSGKVQPLLADVRNVSFSAASFDRVLLFAGLQYLSHRDALELLQRVHHCLAEDGLVYVGDVPDASCRWKFFDTKERRAAYFEALVAGHPIVGTWFDRDWLVYAALHCGFVQAEILDQPDALPYAHYRFDVLLRK
jgi:SAM-dependent methyltransferase